VEVASTVKITSAETVATASPQKVPLFGWLRWVCLNQPNPTVDYSRDKPKREQGAS
jgi:hypothetical protein